MPRSLRLLPLIAALAVLAACTQTGSTSPSAGGGGSESASAQPASASAAPSGSGAATGDCTAETLETQTAGTLTVGTSNPAFPPYVLFPEEAEEATEPWELGDPTKGRGFEAALAYAIADELGFSEDQVEWVVVPFEASFAPGEKEWDMTLQQVSYTEERAEQVDMSEGYYFVNQALVSVEGSSIAGATSMDDLRSAQLGVAQGTTSLAYIEEVIQPESEAMVYNDNDGAVAALEAGQVDGIVVDLPTAFFMIGAEQVENGALVGQFPPAGDEEEYFSIVLEKDSPLTECVNGAIATLRDNGELEQLTEEWMSESAGAPVIEP
jgi:polar amino acid transport system substrate-binding protein